MHTEAVCLQGVNIASKPPLNGGSDVYYAVLNNNDPNPLANAANQGWWSASVSGNMLKNGYGLQFFSFTGTSGTRFSGYVLHVQHEHQKISPIRSLGVGWISSSPRR